MNQAAQKLDYSRQQGAADIGVMCNSHVVIVGVGSASSLGKALVRMGTGRVTCIDPDIVEFRNVASQGYCFDDAATQRPKVEALRDECLAINPELQFDPMQEDFVRLPDHRLKEILNDVDLLIMSTDHHPAQARGALAGLICDVPVLLASLYRLGHCGEIVFQYPGLTKACYRCITRSRYEYVARNRTTGTGSAAGSLPFAPMFVDSIVGFLAVGMLHKRYGDIENSYAKWVDRLGDRNFIQVRMHPDYKLGNEDIFGAVFGHDDKVFCFDTIWQSGEFEVQADCPDCHGQGAIPVGLRANESTEIEQLDSGTLVQRRIPFQLIASGV